MPLSKYYGGSGEKVMKAMKHQYGNEKGEHIFYATHNKRNKKNIDTGPSHKVRRKHRVD